MAALADEPGVLSEPRLCELAGIKRPRRANWAKKGLLRKRKRYGAFDVIELFAFVRLIRELEYEDAVLAWEGIRDDLGGALDAQRLLVIFDWQRKEAWLVTSPKGIGEHVLHGRLSRVIELTTTVAEARDVYERFLE